MTKDDVLQEFKDAEALLSGHFLLSSGLHSDTYLQCARVLMDPRRAERLARALFDRVKARDIGPIDLVVSPAMGGVIIGHEVARQFQVPSVFFERVSGAMTLRRGFAIPKGARCLLVEDVITTGLSSAECLEGVRAEGGEVVAAVCLVSRTSSQRKDLGIPVLALAELDVPTWPPDALPPHLAHIPAIKPGSRFIPQKGEK